METDCNSDYDGSPDVSVEEEEDEEEPQEEQLTCSFKKLNQNEEVKWKLTDAMGTIQSEDSGLMWETSSSRCSTSQASETSATSGVYSMENSFMDCSSGKIMFPMDEEKIVLRRNSPDQTPLSPNEKISPGSTKYDFSGKPMQIKAQEKELDPADPHSWPSQVQPSKIKDYLVHITQDVGTSLSEEKENPLMKKGELPLKGTVRARIQLITAVLEERNKKIFQRVNRKDLPPPSDVIKKPREQPKIFSRQGISVSLRHIERDATDKSNKKEILHYNLKHVETDISKSGVSVPYYKDEKRTRRSFLPQILNKASEKPPPISSILANEAKKPDTKSYSPGSQTPIPEQASLVPPDLHDKTEEKEKQSLLLSTAKIMPENSSNLLAETEKQKMQNYSSVTTEVTDGSKNSKALPEREPAQPCSPLSYPASKAEKQSDSTAMMPSEPTAQEVQYSNNTAATQRESEKSVLVQTRNQGTEFVVPSQLDIKDTALLHFAGEAGKQDKPLYSPEPKQAELPSVSEAEEQEKEQSEMGYSKVAAVQEQLALCLQAESEHLPLLHSMKEMEAGEIETLPDSSSATSRTEAQELQSNLYKSAEELSKLPLPSYVTGQEEHKEKECQESGFIKQAVQAQVAVTTSLEPDHSDVSHSRGKGENQTALPETQCTDSSLPVAYVDREEIQSDSTIIAHSESEHPVIFEPIKAPQGSEPTEPSHLKDKEENQYSPTEELNLSEQLPSISSLLTENIEKQETPLSSLVTAAPLSKHPNSVLPCPTEQTEEHESLPVPPKTAAVAAEASLTTLDLQNVKVTEVEIQPLSPTEVPSEELLPISRESDVVKDRKTTKLVSPLSTEPLSEASVSPQEEVKLENQFGAPINVKLCSEEQDVSHPIVNESQQESQFHSLESTCFELDHSIEPQSRKQTMGQNFSRSSQLEETTALHSVDEGDKKDKHSDKPIIELLDPDLLHSARVLDKQKPQSNIEQTTQQLPHTILPMESDTLHSVEETEINGILSHFPATAQNLPHTIKLMETQENQCVLTGKTALDSRYLTIPSPTIEAEKYTSVEPELKHTEKQSIEAETSGLEPDFQDMSHSVSESDKHLVASVPVQSTAEGDLQSCQPMTAESGNEFTISSEREGEGRELYSLLTPPSKLGSPTTVSKPQRSPNDSFNSSLSEASKPSPVMVSFVPDEIKDQTVAKESIETSVLVSDQAGFLSADLKDKAEIEESQFLLPLQTPELVLDDSPSFTTFPIAEAREEPVASPMTPKIVPQESNSIPEHPVSEEVKEMAPPSSPLSAELLSHETFSPYAVSVGEKQDQSQPMEKRSIEAETSGLEPDFQVMSHSVSESDKHLVASVPVQSTAEGDLQSCQPMTAESGNEFPISSEREGEGRELYSLLTPPSNLGSPTTVSKPQRSPNDSFNSSLNEASKPSPVMVSFVPDEIKDQTVAKESLETSVLVSEQAGFLSADLKDKAEIEESQFLFPVQTPELVLDDSPSFTTFPIAEAREEPLDSPMAPKIVPQESNSIPEHPVSEEVKEMTPPSSPLSAELLSHETFSPYAVSVEERQDQSQHIEKQNIEAETSRLEPDFQDVSYSISESDKHVNASVPVRSTEEGDLQSHQPITPELEYKSPISSEREREEKEYYSLIIPTSKLESPTTASEPERSPNASFSSSQNEASKPSPVMVSFVSDEIKDQAVAKGSLATSVLASEQARFLSADLKDKAEVEGSQFLLPLQTPELVLDDSPSFTAFLIAEAREEPVASPMTPKIVPQESNSIPEYPVSEEVKEMAPPSSPLSAELLSHETFSPYAVSVGEKQDQSQPMEKRSIEAETSGLEPDFQDMSHSVSESDKHLVASVPVQSTAEGDLQSCQPMTAESGNEFTISSEREGEGRELYSLLTPPSKLGSPTTVSKPQRSPNDSFNSSLNEASKPSPVMVSFVPDEIKDQTVAKESLETSVLVSEQAGFLSADLKDKAEIEESQFLFPVQTPELVLDDSPSFTTFPIAEAREEPLDSPMAPKIMPQESNSIPEHSVSEEVKEMAPPSSPLSAELLSHETFSPYAVSIEERQDQSQHMEKQNIEAETSGLEPDFQDVSHSISESDKHLDVSVPVRSTEEGDLQSHQPITPELEYKSPISSEQEREEKEYYSLIIPTSKLESPTTASEPERSPNASFNSSLNEASKPSPVMVSFVSDEIKDQIVAKESIETPVLVSEQAGFLSVDLKDKAEIEGSQFLFPVQTPELVLDDSPSFTAFLIAEAREEPVASPMTPKIVPEESNSIPEHPVSEEVKEMAPPSSPLSAELLSHETFSPYAVSVGEKQDQSQPMEKRSIEAETSGLEPDFQDMSHSVSESDKHLVASVPVQSTAEGDLQSCQPMTPESGNEFPISSEREGEGREFYSLLTPPSKLGSPTTVSKPQRSPNDPFNSSLNEASKPSPVMVSFVPDEIKDQTVAKESIETSVLVSEQAGFLSADLKDKAEIEESQFLFPVQTPELVLDDSPSFTTFPIAEAREEPLDSPMAPKIMPQESNSIPEHSVSEEVKEMAPPSSSLSAELLSHETFSPYAISVGEKQDQSHSFVTEESKYLATGKAGMQEAQSHLLVTAQSGMIGQDTKVYCPETAEPKLEDLTLLDSTEEIKKQETPLHSFPTVLSAQNQELLCNMGAQEIQERVPLGAEHSKEHNVLLKTSIMQQELEQLKFLESGKESSTEGIQPFSSTFVQDSPHLAGETGTQGQHDYLPQTAEVGSVASMLSESVDEAKKHPPPPGVGKLEFKQTVLSTDERRKIQHPLVTSSLDLRHLDLSCSSEIQFYSSEEQNQASEQSPSVSSLLTEKVEEQEVNSHPSAVSIPSANSALLDVSEEDKKQKNQPCCPEVANEMPEEPLSITAFLLSEAKALRACCPLTSETENLDAQPPSKEGGLLQERPGSALALPPATNVTIKREVEPSMTHLESKQFASKPQADVISSCSLEDRTENISDIPTLPNLNQIEPSCAFILKPIHDTHAHNLHSSVSSSDSNTMVNKAIVINAEVLAKTEEKKCLPDVDRDLKEPEKYLQKEKDLKDDEKQREESISAPELDQEKDMFTISEGYQVGKIQAPPQISPVDKEDKHMHESLEYLEAVPVLKTKPFHDTRHLVLEQEPSVCKISEGLKGDIHENKGNGSNELAKAKGVQSAETTMEVSAIPENKCYSIVNATGIDYFEKYTLTDDTSFTQTGKEQSIKDVQRSFDITNENSEEGTSPVSSSECILEFSSLEKEFDKAKKENATATHEATSNILNEAVATKGNAENTEGECNLLGAGAPLFNTEKDVLSQSPLIPLPATAVNPEFLEASPALTFLYEDLYEGAVKESKEDSSKYPSNEETEYTEIDFHVRGHASDDESGIYFKKDIPDDYAPHNLDESQTEKVLKDQPINGQALNQPRVSESAWEPSEKKHEPPHILAESYVPRGVISPTGVVESRSDTLIESPAEIISDVKVEICQPTYAIPFGSGLYSSGASNDDNSQRGEEQYLTEEIDQALPEETSDEESSPILNYAATVYQHETSVQDEAQDVADLAVDQSQQSEITEVHEMNNDVIKSVEESTHYFEASHYADTHRQSEGQPEGNLLSALDEPMEQDAHLFDHKHLPCQDTERQASEKSVGEYIAHDLTELNRETTDQQVPKALSDQPFVELDYSLLSHEFDTYPLYSIKEEEYSDIDEDLAELMDYEMVARDDVFLEEISSEAAHEELLFDDRKSLDRISDTYEFVNEREASMCTEEEEFELMDSEKLPRNVPETEILQKEIEQAQLDSYCYQCKCPTSGEDKLFGEHKEHDVTDLDTAVTVLKSQLDGSLDVLQERSLKIEGFVGEIEALFNSLEENCKEKEQLLEEQNESIVKMVVGHHDRKAQSFEEVKNTKMEYLYEQMMNFQEYIDTAKDTLEAIIKETEEMDDFVFLQSSEDINKRLLSAVEEILTVEKMPAAFSQFEHYAGGSGNVDQTLTHMPVPQTPKLKPQDPNSATSTSIAVYWTVNEDDVIDFFQVYCMEKYPGSKEQSGLVEEYRVTVKESNCILEDLEPGHCYSVWVMAVNYTGCSFPSDKSTFRTTPPTPVINAEECTICWDTATIRWSTSHSEATDSFTVEYCRQYSPEGEGLRSLAGIKRHEMKVRLESNVNYFFYVRAVNTFGMSEQSEAALISTKGTRFHLMKETTHPALQVSPNGAMICLPEDSKLTGISPVLGELLPARGWHYWETTVSGCAAYRVGICSSSIRQDPVLGQNDTSWCLHCSSKTSCVYKVLHNGEMSDVIVTEKPNRIGILLDYNTGRLLFFNAERGQMLSAIRHKFTEAAHPAFVLEQPGVLNLHTGMELPEFVEQS